MNRHFNVGLVGFGNAGEFYHAPYIDSLEFFNLCQIRETKPEKIAIIKKRYPHVNITSDASTIFANPAIDIVIIAAPNQYHFDLAKQSLLAGKHVVVDKPFTVTTFEADELIDLSQQSGKVVAVYHNRRFASDFRTVEKLLKNNVLGEIVEYEAHFDRFRKEIRYESWKEAQTHGSGIFYDMGSHLIDQALYLFGVPNEIFADLRVQRKEGAAIDNFELKLYYERLKVSLKGSMLANVARPQFALFGERGCFIKHGMDIQEKDIRNGKRPGSTDWGMEPESMWGHLTLIDEENKVIKSEQGNFGDFYTNLYNHLGAGEELLIKPFEARNVIRAIELAIKSNEEKRVVCWS
jgi:predicted dehydrogenase